MLLSWFDASEAKEFGISLAKFYIERLPLDAPNKPVKAQETLTKMLQQVARFKLNHQLNVYRKAQLGNAFKWTLKDAGYDSHFADALTKELMIDL